MLFRFATRMFAPALAAFMMISACGGGGGGGIYCCTYDSRHSACGGGSWTDWETESFEFNIDDYVEGWTPEDVCGQYDGSDLECGGSCCIYVEYDNNELTDGGCS